MPLEIVVLKYGCLLRFLLDLRPKDCFEDRCHLQACKYFDYQVTITAAVRAAVVWNGHKAAAVLINQIWLLGKQSLNGSPVLGCKLEWNGPGKSPLSLYLTKYCSFLKFNFHCLSQQVWLQCFACCRCARCGCFPRIPISFLLRILFPF